jgi:hypothetical protein
MPNETTTRYRRPEEYPQPEVHPQTSAEWQAAIDRLKVKLANLERSQSDLETKKANLALDVEFGDKAATGSLATLLAEIARVAQDAELARMALGRAHASLKSAQAREAGEVEDRRLAQIAELKQELMSAAVEFDVAALQLKAALSKYHSLGDRIHNLMNPVEQRGFQAARGSIGPSNAMGAHGVARPLGMATGSPIHHQSLESYARVFCSPPQPSAPPPPREKVEIEFMTEAEALSQPRPR